MDGEPEEDNVQALTWCMAIGWDRTRGNHVIECYRLHPVEWNIGESAGLLAAGCCQ